jgi:hypothetical protein
MITVERLREVLTYDPAAGEWHWHTTDPGRGRRRASKLAGSVQKNGYRVIRIDRHLYQSSRLAFLYMTGEWPRDEVDHKDGNPANDRWDNLRPATRANNNANVRMQCNNRFGLKGVLQLPNQKWRARIKGLHLGCFSTKEEAHAAYCQAARQHFGEFARFH